MMTFNVDHSLFEQFDRLREASHDIDDVTKIGVVGHAKEIEDRLNAPMGHPTSHEEGLGGLSEPPRMGNHTPHSYSRMVEVRDQILLDVQDRVAVEYLAAAQQLIESWKRLSVVNSVARSLGAVVSVDSQALNKLFLPGAQRGPLAAHSQRLGANTGLISPAAERKLLGDDIKALRAKFAYGGD